MTTASLEPVVPRTAPTQPSVTRAARCAVRLLRAGVRYERNLFDAREVARLRIVRWLSQTGWLLS